MQGIVDGLLRVRARFYIIGLAIAFLEEFITQGVLKRNILGWVIPAAIAFVPFLVGANFIHKSLEKKVTSVKRAELAYYIFSGAIGLMVEWFLIGLSPWGAGGASDPIVTLLFQLGIFSFWATVAFAPRLILDRRAANWGLRGWYKRFLALGFLAIYALTLTSSRQIQFTVGIISVLALFLSLNVFHYTYIRRLPAIPSSRSSTGTG